MQILQAPQLFPPRLAGAMRRLKVAGLGAMLAVCGTTSLQNAVANGDTRTLLIHHTHTGESGTFTFKKDGRYDTAILEKLNWFLRDWRTNEPTKMDPQLFDIVWEVYRETDAASPIQVVSSYRSPATNAMLRSRSRGVAKSSQHMLGKAMDFFIPGVELARLREAGLRLQRGGVGFYPTSGSPFVHLDTGSVRHWPRMSHDQLVRVFPDGKTVHVPSDGRPLAKYDVALAELQARGSRPGVAVASADAGKGVKSFFSKLMGRKDDDDDEGGAPEPQGQAVAAAAPAPAASPAAPAAADAAGTRLAAAPLPRPRPAEIASAAIVTAALASAPMPPARPAALAQASAATIAPAPRPAPGVQVASLPGAPLPELITGEPARGSLYDARAALGYAAAGNIGPEASPLHGGLIAAPREHAEPAVPPSAVARLRERGKPAPAAPARRPAAPVEVTSAVTFDRLFLASSLSSDLTLRQPELRVFTAFVSAPQTVVAQGFSRDGSFGLKSGFVGPAVVPLPTYAFRAGAMAVSQRM
ncbi:DUF882 domain-containing protein [Xanthobacter pseudotagetidis]|uniref:DUF882 domain-containing protein n=1 Tax=Xanthobacter pseudotagetidis TaxID=3119911 RepID=UPI00372BBB5C